jgi:hypothetical protein
MVGSCCVVVVTLIRKAFVSVTGSRASFGLPGTGRNHRCPAPCHLVECAPCPLTARISCACGKTQYRCAHMDAWQARSQVSCRIGLRPFLPASWW